MNKTEEAQKCMENWYNSLQVYPQSGGPARGTIAAALVVLERLKASFDLNLAAHRAKGQSQITGVGQASVRKILIRFGETRPFLGEGGRTNRGAPGDIGKLLRALGSLKLKQLVLEERVAILTVLQQFLVDRVRQFHSKQRLKITYDSSRTTWQAIRDMLNVAQETGKEGPVSQYLVGAKLQLRFPQLEIRNASYSTADEQKGLSGDFRLGDTVFHVTVSPMPPVYEKCKANVQSGLRAILLVPDRRLVGARQTAEDFLPGKLTVESIESFVAQNIEEISAFSTSKLAYSLRQLIETYNKRVDAVEPDKSMLVDLPQNLRG